MACQEFAAVAASFQRRTSDRWNDVMRRVVETARSLNGKVVGDYLDGPVYWAGEGTPPPGWGEEEYLCHCEARVLRLVTVTLPAVPVQ